MTRVVQKLRKRIERHIAVADSGARSPSVNPTGHQITKNYNYINDTNYLFKIFFIEL